MQDIPTRNRNLQIILHDDGATPRAFLADLLRHVFIRSDAEAEALAVRVDIEGEAICGVYPETVAEAMRATAMQRAKTAGHSLDVTTVPPDVADGGDQVCSFCGTPGDEDALFSAERARICCACLSSGASHLSGRLRTRRFKYARDAADCHFTGLDHDAIATTTRIFPGHMRADVQVALDALLSKSCIRFFGLYEQHRYETLTYASLTKDGQYAIAIAPAQFEDIDIGDSEPVKCLRNGLWLNRDVDLRYAVLLSFHREYGREAGMCIEIAVAAGEEGAAFVQRCFGALEEAVNAARSYRGKVLSFDADEDYRGRSKGIVVHRLPPVRQEEVILPAATLKLLDRNVLRFVESREMLRRLGQSTRKGILLYGPPGTGKTHTIRYLANNLPGHTTLIITAGQMGLLSLYMNLARLLQPAMVVIEDVDLIARDREAMNGPCEEALLNALLNEMDGLKEDADILFVLITNRPQQLEAALTGRPGRIDQAIEVPLPDASGREQLIHLYGGGLQLSPEIVKEAVARTEGASAAFIKEMMRRTAQAGVVRGGAEVVTAYDLAEALDEMMFTGGRLNIKLLGGPSQD
jgi:AAA+ superfamily predicted ATPase/ATP-dependent Clp protease adapter protein ClpS